MSQEQYAAKGGLKIKTLQRIELEQVTRPYGTTLSGLDKAADWPDGTARAIFEEGAEVPEEATVPVGARDGEPEDEAVAALRRMVELIPSIRRRFGNEQAEAMVGRIMTLAQTADLTEFVAEELRRHRD